ALGLAGAVQPTSAGAAPDPAPAKPAPSRAALDGLRHLAARHGGRRVAVPRKARAVRVRHVDQFRQAGREGFRRVSDLVAFPPFYPGLGVVTVKPDTLPMGPYRCFDRAGGLVATVYMPLLADMDAHKTWDKVKGLPAPVDHATMYYHPGHAGVNVPHYHVVLWHVRNEAVVAK
ncbi:MAG: hypothetical protein INR64_17985, partial [Caulobacteraceae bacterium]|nr:hypothetical protein [Caulobacter sp.]